MTQLYNFAAARVLPTVATFRLLVSQQRHMDIFVGLESSLLQAWRVPLQRSESALGTLHKYFFHMHRDGWLVAVLKRFVGFGMRVDVLDDFECLGL